MALQGDPNDLPAWFLAVTAVELALLGSFIRRSKLCVEHSVAIFEAQAMRAKIQNPCALQVV